MPLTYANGIAQGRRQLLLAGRPDLQFWEGEVPGLSAAEDLAPAGTVVQFGVPPSRIDLINEIEGVSFDEAWQGRVECRLVPEGGEIPLRYLGLNELIRNKRATGRPKDLDDLDYLTGVD